MPARAPDPLAAVETADRASTARSAWALRDDEADEEEMQRELEKLDGDLARVKKDAAEVAGVGLDDDAYEPRAPKRRAERVAHRSPFESESEEAPADVDDDRARKTAKRAHHRTASASGSESSLDLDLSDEALEDFAFDTADAMDLEEYAGLARARRVKLERFEDVLADEAQMRELLRRAVAKVARGEAVRPVAPGDISRALGFEISSSLAEKRREQILAEARQSLSAADASVGKAEDSEAEDSESPKDAGFEDATWAEDDYRASATSTKDPNAMNRLDPVVSAPGAPSEKTDDETMAKLLKHVEENKATIAEQVIRDDGELDEDAFIQELVREGAIVAPEDEPEKGAQDQRGQLPGRRVRWGRPQAHRERRGRQDAGRARQPVSRARRGGRRGQRARRDPGGVCEPGRQRDGGCVRKPEGDARVAIRGDRPGSARAGGDGGGGARRGGRGGRAGGCARAGGDGG
jgi:hypothetical protein